VIVVTSGAFVVKLVRGLHSDKNVDIMKLFSSLLIYLACERRYISGCAKEVFTAIVFIHHFPFLGKKKSFDSTILSII